MLICQQEKHFNHIKFFTRHSVPFLQYSGNPQNFTKQMENEMKKLSYFLLTNHLNLGSGAISGYR